MLSKGITSALSLVYMDAYGVLFTIDRDYIRAGPSGIMDVKGTSHRSRKDKYLLFYK